MSYIKYLKGECQRCGGHIEFPADAIGRSVDCPHCSRPTELILPTPPEVPVSSRRNMTWVVVGVIILVIGAIGSAAGWILLKRLAARGKRHEAAALPAERAKSAAQAAPSTNSDSKISSDSFSVSPIMLEKTTGSTLVYATGTVKNESNRQRFGVKVEVELFDGAGAKVGSASDYLPVLEPKAEWRFKAIVLQSKAASAKLASIKEDQ